MLWYVNEASLQGQFSDEVKFINLIKSILKMRTNLDRFSRSFYLSRNIGESNVMNGISFKELVRQCSDQDFRRQILAWVTKRGPFLEDERQFEEDDYFSCLGLDVTNGGLGESARQIKAGRSAESYSFPGGKVDFCHDCLLVEHGLAEDIISKILVHNHYNIEGLEKSFIKTGERVISWQSLFENARERFQLLLLPDSLYMNSALAGESFESSIAERTLDLLKHLNDYMASRDQHGNHTGLSNEIIRNLFTNANGGDSKFSAESNSNKVAYKSEMTFLDPEDQKSFIFAHWHGKIPHRYFRMHFEWPVKAASHQLKVLYLGPKITKS